ncbi:MFS transporter [Methanobacterium sp. MBAC-LM]|uniref:MFS transporter n=1 Tax=Methanobacterium sp. MBAC-LM TaxID=3412034 RepID=UPI003C78B815
MFGSLKSRILAVIFAGAVLIAIDGSTVSPILESIQKSFGVNESVITWIFNIEILFLMLGTPIMAKLSDQYGRKNIYILNAILFLFGTVTTAFSQSFEMLVIGRVFQGIGAVLSVLAITIIGDYFDETRGTILGVFGVVIALVYALGPAISGFLVNYSWHWVFIINIPVAAAVVILGYFLLPSGKVTEKYASFDWKGMTFLSIAIASIAYFIFNLSGQLQSSVQYLVFTVFILALIGFWWVERKVIEPILPIDLLKKRDTLIASVVTLVGYFAMGGTYYLSTFAAIAFNLNYSMAAYMILPMTIASLITTPIVGKLLDKTGAKPIMVIGGIITAIGMLFLSYASNPYTFGFSLIFIGVGNASIVGNALYYIFLGETEKSKRASGQALLNILLNTGSLLGGSILASALDFSVSGAASFRSVYLYLAAVYVFLTILSFGLRCNIIGGDNQREKPVNL